MNRVNILLHNHGPIRYTGAPFEPHVNYFWRTLHALGFAVTVSDEKLERSAVNLYFEYFPDERLLHKLFAFKRAYGIRVGVVATELIVDDDIPYLRDGDLHVEMSDRRVATKEEVTQASRIRVKNLLAHAGSFDFTWSLLDRTHALLRRFNRQSFFFPIGYLEPSRPVAVVPKDIDVLFYGAMTPRRAAVIEKIRATKLNVLCVGRNTEAGYAPEFALDSFIDRAKLVLNLTFADPKSSAEQQFASSLRIASALSRGALVVSETIAQDNPYCAYMVNCDADNLPGRCAELVRSSQHTQLGQANFANFKETMRAEDIDAPAVEVLRTF